MLPNWICIGAGRAGTTTLWEILRHHPDIYLPIQKECNFFGSLSSWKGNATAVITETGLALARYEFDFFSSRKSEKSVGEITPGYLHYETAAAEIAEKLGNKTKILVSFRHPIQRAYSHYKFWAKTLVDTGTFKEAMTIDERIGRAININYFKCSLYSDYIKEYQKYFPKDNLLFMVFEKDIIQNLDKTVARILDFLGVDTKFKIDPRIHINRSAIPKINYYSASSKIEEKQLDTGKIYKYTIPPNTIAMITGWPGWDKIITNPSAELKRTLLIIKKNLEKGLDPEFEAYLIKKFFLDDIHSLEDAIDIDLSFWYEKYL